MIPKQNRHIKITMNFMIRKCTPCAPQNKKTVSSPGFNRLSETERKKKTLQKQKHKHRNDTYTHTQFPKSCWCHVTFL